MQGWRYTNKNPERLDSPAHGGVILARTINRAGYPAGWIYTHDGPRESPGKIGKAIATTPALAEGIALAQEAMERGDTRLAAALLDAAAKLWRSKQ